MLKVIQNINKYKNTKPHFNIFKLKPKKETRQNIELVHGFLPTNQSFNR